jgi:molybdenum cofactor guanylyltransferase
VSHPDTLGVILAGGRARRMGGIDKGSIRIGGATILERVLTRLRGQCARLVLNANAEAAPFPVDVPIVADSVADFPGPLAGILAGLDFAAAQMPEIAWVVSVPSDCPFLPRDLVSRLHQARHAAGATLACATSAGKSPQGRRMERAISACRRRVADRTARPVFQRQHAGRCYQGGAVG